MTAVDPDPVATQDRLEFTAIGDPAPQGSKRAFVVPGKAGAKARAIVADANPAPAARWRDAVVLAARAAADQQRPNLPPLDGPLMLTCDFTYRMPASRSAAVRRSGVAWKASGHDLDKLVRGVCDALTAAGVIRDDSRIATLFATKMEAADLPAGVRITVEPVAQ